MAYRISIDVLWNYPMVTVLQFQTVHLIRWGSLHLIILPHCCNELHYFIAV